MPTNNTEFFKDNFVTDLAVISERRPHIKAFIFDWDGVFNNGHKQVDGNSSFSEIDSMGVNLLRFNHYLQSGQQAITAIITGEHNQTAFNFAGREHFHSVYYKIKHKETALLHLCKTYSLHPSEVMFTFDDVLDFSASKLAGIRVMVSRACNPLLIQFAIDHGLVDYITKQDGANGAVRELSEWMMQLSDRYTETLENRMQFSEKYKAYIDNRNTVVTNYLSIDNSGEIVQKDFIGL
jgi:3-deoxy-D-manno-octulosonate 8-phosphate phosphatase (KDO 8-P phosphatase)